MQKKKINISNYSIGMLENQNYRWYQCYALGNWDNEFIPKLRTGVFFHEVRDQYTKTGQDKTQYYKSLMIKEFRENGVEESEMWQEVKDFENLCANCFEDFKIDFTTAEEEVIFEINEKYNFKAKIDGVDDNFLYDYKGVKSFVNPEGRGEYGPDKYKQQLYLYMWAYYKKHDVKKGARLVEVRKTRPSLTREKKSDIISLCEEAEGRKLEDFEKKLTKDELIATFNPRKSAIQIIEFEFTDEVIPFCEKLINKAVFKANMLLKIPREHAEYIF